MRRKTGLHIGWQRFEFISNAIVEQFHDPCHPFKLLHFCNVGERHAGPYRNASDYIGALIRADEERRK